MEKHQTNHPAIAVPGVHPYSRYGRKLNCKPYIKLLRTEGQNTEDIKYAARTTATWQVPALCTAYGWPTKLAGGGTIAIVELGGGWVMSDMEKYFKSIKQPVPHITDVSVDGTQNTPDPDPNGPDGEVALDIQVAGAAYYAATGKAATIRVYWVNQDIAEAVRAATADGCDVCSISWGADESNWGQTAGDDMEQAATDATTAGMIVFAASGDNDSSDGGPDPANVDLPASAPHVVGCGGTKKTTTAETVWNEDPGNPSGEGTGGGYSTLFPVQSWQIGAPNGPGRMVPDVSANADPVTGYDIVLHGKSTIVGGTSAVAPLYAGLFAAFGTKLGFMTPELYLNQVCFNDIVDGDNGAFRAQRGPDPCTGIGSPIGSKIANLFSHPSGAGKRRLQYLEKQNSQLRRTIAQLLGTAS